MFKLPSFSMALVPTLVALTFACTAQAQSDEAVAPTPEQVKPAVDQAYQRLMASPAIAGLLEAVKADHGRSLAELKQLNEIEAPPFKEQKRGEDFLARVKALGMTDARIDAEGNVIALRKGAGNGPKLVVSAHLDTVFPAGTDVKVKEKDGRFLAPGIADDGRGLSVLLSWIKVLDDNKVQTVGDVLFVANTGEEGLGDLRGMKRLFAEQLDIDGLVGLEPMPDGGVLVLGTGSKRYEFVFKGPGGHSFDAFGKVPSAIHGMGLAIAKISRIQTPSEPKTTFTVGVVSGGQSVNSIAPEAKMAVDVRSNEMGPLLETTKKVMAAVDEAVAEENARWGVKTLSVSHRIIGDRPGGRTPINSPIVEAAIRANTAFGQKTSLKGLSTDANVPMSLGIPAIIVGSGGSSGNYHALSEWFDPTDAWKGAQTSLMTVLGLVGVQGVSEPLLPKRPARAK